MDNLLYEANQDILGALTLEDLDVVRHVWLGKGGRMELLLRQLGALPADQRSEQGKELNQLKIGIGNSFAVQKEKILNAMVNSLLD